MRRFVINEKVKVVPSAHRRWRPGHYATVIGVIEPPAGSTGPSDQYPGGILYLIEFVDGTVCDIQEHLLDKSPPRHRPWAMPGKRQKSERMKTANICFPPEMLDALKRAALERGLGENGMGQEIRNRLAGSLIWDEAPRETHALIDCIWALAAGLQEEGCWYQNPFTFEVFKAGIAELLARYQPEGDLVPLPGIHVLYGEGDDPVAAGRKAARWVLRDAATSVTKA
jgi:hypothetical protein